MAVCYTLYALIGLSTFVIYGVKSTTLNRRKWICSIYFILLFLMFSLRHPSMGVDLGYGYSTGYLGSFSRICEFSWLEVLTAQVLNYERGYIIFNKFLSLFSQTQQCLLFGTSFIAILPLVYLIYKDSKSPLLSVFVYMGLPSFMMLFSGLRQAIAIGLCALSILYVQRKKLKHFVITILVASTFHKSSFVFLLAYPVYHFPVSKSLRTISFAIPPIVYILRYPLFRIFSRLFKENAVPDNNNAITLFLVFYMVYIFCSLFSDESTEVRGLKNLFFVACCIQAIGGVYSTVLRVGYYFMSSAVLLLPLITHRLHNRSNARIINIVVGTCFVLFGLFSLRNSTWAMSYPYYWFWN